jgi:hypothetical protein
MYSIEETKKLRLEFWEQFGFLCKSHPLLRHKNKKWILHRTKIKGVALRFYAGRKNAQIILELSNRNENKRLQAFEILQKYKPILEDGFVNGLKWEFYHQREDSGQEVCRIFTELENVDLLQHKHWPSIFNYFIEEMSKLEDNFLQIRDMLKEELQEN